MISGIHISSSQMVIKKGDEANKQSLPEFKNSQIIKAKILQLLPNGKTRILVNNQKIVAKTAMLLKPGEEVQLKVISQQDATILKLINPLNQMTTKQIASLVSLFVKNNSTPDLSNINDIKNTSNSKVDRIREILYEISLKSDKSDKTFLPKLIAKSGITYENKIANVLSDSIPAKSIKVILNSLLKQDFKGIIFQELLTSNAQNLRTAETMKVASAFLETIENFQLLNHQSSDSGRFLLPFPVFSESAFSFGQLLIDTGDKNKSKKQDGNKVINISFLLNMSKLGPLKADFSILKKEITGRFLLVDDDTCEYVRSMIDELKVRLEKIEYHALNIECQTAKKEEIQPGTFIETLIQAGGDDRVLNIVI
jgi:hypothetical protein